MENKINIAELLKDCPKGMELDCTIWNGVTFEGIDSSSPSYPIKIKIKGDKTTVTEYLTKFGEWNTNENSKCIIFPKGKTTWEGFVPPRVFKDGDIITCTNSCCAFVSIFKEKRNEISFIKYCELILDDNEFIFGDNWSDFSNPRFATEEEKEKLFGAIKANGYKWNEETKTLEKLIEPKFKVGDYIRQNKKNIVRLVSEVCDNHYLLDEKDISLPFFAQDVWELVPNKFDINTLKPFESKVLVREGKTDVWQPSYYGFLNQRNKRFYTTTNTWSMCIPYNEDTKHLIGTTNDCDDFYKTWE